MPANDTPPDGSAQNSTAHDESATPPPPPPPELSSDRDIRAALRAFWGSPRGIAVIADLLERGSDTAKLRMFDQVFGTPGRPDGEQADEDEEARLAGESLTEEARGVLLWLFVQMELDRQGSRGLEMHRERPEMPASTAPAREVPRTSRAPADRTSPSF